MYLRSERPATPDERQQLERMLADNWALTGGALVCLVILLGLLSLKGLELYLDQWKGTFFDNRVACWLTVAFLGLLLGFPLHSLSYRRHERRHLRATLADGLLVVEQVEAAAAARINGSGGYWLILTVEANRLLVLPQSLAGLLLDFRRTSGGVVPVQACFELLTTASGRLVVNCQRLGTSILPLRPTLTTSDLVSDTIPERQRGDGPRAGAWGLCDTSPERQRRDVPSLALRAGINKQPRRHLEKRLDTAVLLPGRGLDTCALVRDVGNALRGVPRGFDLPAPAPETTESVPPPDAWPLALLQGRLENVLHVALGPGRLAGYLRRVQQEQGRPAAAADLLPLFLGRTPEGPDLAGLPPDMGNVFYRLRHILSEQFQLHPGSIRPSTPLDTIVPRIDRRSHWDCVSRQWPGFHLCGCLRQQYPNFVSGLMLLGVAAAVILHILTAQALGAFARRHGFDHSAWFAALSFFLLPMTFLAALLLGGGSVLLLFRGFATLEFGPGMTTVGELARYLAQVESRQSAEQVPWNEETVWLAVRQVLATMAGVRPLEISRTTPIRQLVAGLGPTK